MNLSQRCQLQINRKHLILNTDKPKSIVILLNSHPTMPGHHSRFGQGRHGSKSSYGAGSQRITETDAPVQRKPRSEGSRPPAGSRPRMRRHNVGDFDTGALDDRYAGTVRRFRDGRTEWYDMKREGRAGAFFTGERRMAEELEGVGEDEEHDRDDRSSFKIPRTRQLRKIVSNIAESSDSEEESEDIIASASRRRGAFKRDRKILSRDQKRHIQAKRMMGTENEEDHERMEADAHRRLALKNKRRLKNREHFTTNMRKLRPDIRRHTMEMERDVGIEEEFAYHMPTDEEERMEIGKDGKAHISRGRAVIDMEDPDGELTVHSVRRRVTRRRPQIRGIPDAHEEYRKALKSRSAEMDLAVKQAYGVSRRRGR